MSRRKLIQFLLVAAGAAGALAAPAMTARRRRRLSSAMARAANSFLNMLGSDQRTRASMPFDTDERFDWHYVPRSRKGLPLGEMTGPQRDAALALLQMGLSARGFSKAQIIRQLELVLKDLEHGSPVRDPENYYFTIFGTPGEDTLWGWRYEGHHCSQNWTIVDGAAIASSPQFFGSNPAEVRSGPMKGTRVLHAEEDLARALLHSLTADQRKEAILSETAPADILTTNERQVAIAENRGIRHDRLNPSQQVQLMALIEEYANAQTRELSAGRLEKIRHAGLDGIRFAWMGGLEKGEGHYYRVQGPTFLMEYDNTQNNANHIHAVWRDYQGDFGLDALAEHYRTSVHHDRHP